MKEWMLTSLCIQSSQLWSLKRRSSEFGVNTRMKCFAAWIFFSSDESNFPAYNLSTSINTWNQYLHKNSNAIKWIKIHNSANMLVLVVQFNKITCLAVNKNFEMINDIFHLFIADGNFSRIFKNSSNIFWCSY